MKDAQVLIDAAKQILHLHMCEQEGLQSGQPSPQQWFEAVDNLSAAIALVESPGSEQEAQVCDATKAQSELPASGYQKKFPKSDREIKQEAFEKNRQNKSGSSNVREEELEQTFIDNADCYADTGDGPVVIGLTTRRIVEVLQSRFHITPKTPSNE